MTDHRDDIDEIMDWFDFERVHRVMEFLDWRWNESVEIPSIPELRQQARRLLNTACESVIRADDTVNTFTSACGGFWARARRYPDDDKIYLDLAFQLAEWSNHE